MERAPVLLALWLGPSSYLMGGGLMDRREITIQRLVDTGMPREKAEAAYDYMEDITAKAEEERANRYPPMETGLNQTGGTSPNWNPDPTIKTIDLSELMWGPRGTPKREEMEREMER